MAISRGAESGNDHSFVRGDTGQTNDIERIRRPGGNPHDVGCACNSGSLPHTTSSFQILVCQPPPLRLSPTRPPLPAGCPWHPSADETIQLPVHSGMFSLPEGMSRNGACLGPLRISVPRYSARPTPSSRGENPSPVTLRRAPFTSPSHPARLGNSVTLAEWAKPRRLHARMALSCLPSPGNSDLFSMHAVMLLRV